MLKSSALRVIGVFIVVSVPVIAGLMAFMVIMMLASGGSMLGWIPQFIETPLIAVLVLIPIGLVSLKFFTVGVGLVQRPNEYYSNHSSLVHIVLLFALLAVFSATLEFIGF